MSKTSDGWHVSIKVADNDALVLRWRVFRMSRVTFIIKFEIFTFTAV